MTVSPAGKASTPASSLFEIKSAQLPMVALMLKSSDLKAVAQDLLQQYGPDGESAGFFENDPLVLDFSQANEAADEDELSVLFEALQACLLVPIAYRAPPPQWAKSLAEKGLVEAPQEIQRAKTNGAAVASQPAETPAAAQPLPTPAAPPVLQEVIREVPGPATMVIDKPLRSGQKVYARGADLVVLAMVNQGAEVVADGNIHVYAPLRGKAMAGARGNTQARIFSLCLEPELVSIAGVYRTSENPFPESVAGKPAQVRLSTDGQENLLFEALKN